MANLKVSKTRRANQKTAVALYKIMEAHSKKLGKELKRLERRNKELQKRILTRTLAKYGAEDDIDEWMQQGESSPAEINRLLNERWQAVQDRMMFLQQQRQVMSWGRNWQPAMSFMREAPVPVVQPHEPLVVLPVGSPPSQNELAKSASRDHTEFEVGFEVNKNMLRNLLGSRSSGASDSKTKANSTNGNHYPPHVSTNGTKEGSNVLVSPSNPGNHLIHLVKGSAPEIATQMTYDNGDQAKVDNPANDDEHVEVDNDSEDEGLPLELTNNPALILAQAKAIDDRYGDSLERPLHLGFVLERQDNQPYWGLTLSLFDRSCLMVVRINEDLIQGFTKHAKASYKPPSSTHVNPKPEAFLDAFQDTVDGVHALKPGDIILSINGRSSHMFSTLRVVTEYVKRFRSLCLVVVRAQNIVHHDDDSYEEIKDCYLSLRKKKILSNAKISFARKARKKLLRNGNGNATVASMPSCVANNLFNDDCGNPIFFDEVDGDEEPGSRSQNYLTVINKRNFYRWIASRKESWREKWTCEAEKDTSVVVPLPPLQIPASWRNPIFQDEEGNKLSYDDNFEEEHDDGKRSSEYLWEMGNHNFPSWLNKRKESWRQTWKAHEVTEDCGENVSLCTSSTEGNEGR